MHRKPVLFVALALGGLLLLVALAGEPQSRRAPGLTPQNLTPQNALKSLAKDLSSLREQLTEIRARITKQELEPDHGTRGSQATWPEICCQAQVDEMRKPASSMSSAVKQLQSIYQQANHREGIRLSGQMAGQVRQLNQAINTLAAAKDARGMQAALSNLDKVVKRLEQSVARAKKCCTPVPPQPAARPASAGTPATAAPQLQPTTQLSPQNALKAKEYASLTERREVLESKLHSQNPLTVKKAKADWAKLLADFKSWAKKYNIDYEVKEVQPSKKIPAGGAVRARKQGTPGVPRGPAIPKSCPPIIQTPCQCECWCDCELVSQRADKDGNLQCEYKCECAEYCP